MASVDIFAVKPHVVSRDLKGYTILLYGAPKTGKTTIASKFSKALLLGFEAGYLTDISISEPMLTKVWGNIVCTTIENRTETENAFGAPTVNITTRTLRAWDIEGASVDPMEFGDESTMTAEDVAEGKNNRELHLVEVRANHDEYQRSKDNAFNDDPPFSGATTVKSASPTAAKNFKF